MVPRIRARWSMLSLLLGVTMVAAAVALWLAPGDQAILRETGRELDVAIMGRGYFQLIDPSGSVVFTRQGHWELDEVNRSLRVNMNGQRLLLEPMIIIPRDCQRVRIDPTGMVLGTCGEIGECAFGKFQLALFEQPTLLTRTPEDALQATPESGNARSCEAGERDAGLVQQGWLEGPPTLAESWPRLAPLIILATSSLLLVASFWQRS